MIGLILAAGVSKRLQGLNNGLPKCCLQVAGATIIERSLQAMDAAGTRRTVVVTGYRKDHLEQAYAGRAEFVFNPFYQQSNTMASMWMGLRDIDEDVLSMNGDTVFDHEVLKRLLDTPGDIVLACDNKPCGEEEVKYTCDENGNVVELNKEVDPEQALGEFSGVCLIRRSALRKLRAEQERLLSAGEFTAYFEAAFEALLAAKTVKFTPCDISDLIWCEIDFPADLERAQSLFESQVQAAA